MGRLIASGDLYQRDIAVPDDFGSIALAPPPDPAGGIPIFPIKGYRYYLWVTQIVETGGAFRLAFETHPFSVEAVTLLDGSARRRSRSIAYPYPSFRWTTVRE